MRFSPLVACLLAAGPAWAQSPPFPQIERGRYLAAVGDCTACHTGPAGPAFAGGLALNTPFGTIYSSNITPDRKTGIGAWSEDDFWRALHDGKRRDGSQLYPAMPYPWTTHVTREDSDAIFAYLRTLPAVERPKPANDLFPPLNLRVSVDAWNLLYFKPEIFAPDPQQSEAWNRGAYIVTGLGHCGACHTRLNMLGAAEDSHPLQGNTLDGWYAPDIAGKPPSGPGAWTDDETVAYLQTGRNDRALATGPMADVVMHSTQHMTPADLRAISVYLHALPNAAPTPSAPAADAKRHAAGMALYQDNCAACHGAQGNGATQLIPSLIGDGAVTGADPITVLRAILHGATGNHTSFAPSDPAMPAFDWKLSDAEVAAVATYVRTSWGNQASAVDASAARALREKLHTAGDD